MKASRKVKSGSKGDRILLSKFNQRKEKLYVKPVSRPKDEIQEEDNSLRS